MAQLVARVSSELLGEIDGLVAEGAVGSRSDAVRTALETLVDTFKRARVGQAIVEGYLRHPQSSSEVGWPDEASIAMIAEEPW